MMKSVSRVSRVFLALVALFSMLAAPPADAFTFHKHTSRPATARSPISRSTVLGMSSSNDNDKFSFGQRIESTKCVVVGALSGGIAVTPLTALHDILLGPEMNNGVAQWEFDTDMGILESSLFAVVYRYCIRTDDNPMLNQGVFGAFVLVRTLSRIRVPSYCTAAPLDCECLVMCVGLPCYVCVLGVILMALIFVFLLPFHFAGGAPLGYFDWSMIQQGALSGIESAALFGGAALAMEYCFRKGYISKFPG